MEIKRMTENVPKLLTIGKHLPHFQVRRGQSNHGRLVQLLCDHCGQRQQLAQLAEFGVLLLAPRAGRRFAFFLHRGNQFGICANRGQMFLVRFLIIILGERSSQPQPSKAKK